jgi:flagellar hook assembly protein FlgD
LRNSQFADPGEPENGLQVYPEIFSPGNDGNEDVIVFSVKTGTPGFVAALSILNMNGEQVYARQGCLLPATRGTFTWDGVTVAGQRAATGIYLAYVQMYRSEGTVRNYRCPFVIGPGK